MAESMSEEARKARAEYMRKYLPEWRKNNRDKVKKHQETYWEKKYKENEN